MNPSNGDRYHAEGPEAEAEPGSHGRVLRNLVGVRSVRDMARRESEALLSATHHLIDETDLDHRFTASVHARDRADVESAGQRFEGR